MTTTWTPEQQAEHRKLWVEALRSGKYQQTTSQLRLSGRYCCLGVACDLSGVGAWEFNNYIVTNDDEEDTTLPDGVKDWLGLSTNGGRFDNGKRSEEDSSLWGLNDNGTTFAEIADIIEAAPPGLLAEHVQS